MTTGTVPGTGTLYPTLEAATWADLSAILKRTRYRAEDWQRELSGALPQQFGVASWTKAEVGQAVTRLETALKHAANLDTLLRKHTLAQILHLFAPTPEHLAPPDETLRTWLTAHSIPAENDLAEAARILLGQLQQSADVETTLLITLPRALPQIAQSYQQWSAYAELTQYVQTVAAAVRTIDEYTPLNDAEWAWLSGMPTTVLRRPLASPPREQHRLAQAVTVQTTNWLREQHLPACTPTLSALEVSELVPALTAAQLTALLKLLTSADQMKADPTSFWLNELPQALGLPTPSATWTTADVEALLSDVGIVCGWLSKLPTLMTQHLFSAIGPIFGVEGNGSGASTLVAKLRTWRQSYVLLANEHLSPDATLLAELLIAPTDDPFNLLLTTLPSKLREVRAPYGTWQAWAQRNAYLHALTVAATELAERGQMSEATPRVVAFWTSVKTGLAKLSPDERRWLIKAFNEELQA
ncbi:MAG: hypothetical protein WCP31_00030 [Chloroflexales bacterium]